jgi:hypothetical protein
MMEQASYYYEIAEGHVVDVNRTAVGKSRQVVVDPRRDRKSYVCEHDSDGWSVALARVSLRVWEETSRGIRIVKNRFSKDTTVDMKEFFLVKLSSREL